MKEYITGIGGVFFRAKSSHATREWYKNVFGLESESWGKVFPWKHYDNPSEPGSTSWGVFKNESDYFGNPAQQYMINYRVKDMEELLEKLRAQGIQPVKAMESHDYGKFVWIEDCDGNRIELWEPIDAAFGL